MESESLGRRGTAEGEAMRATGAEAVAWGRARFRRDGARACYSGTPETFGHVPFSQSTVVP